MAAAQAKYPRTPFMKGRGRVKSLCPETCS